MIEPGHMNDCMEICAYADEKLNVDLTMEEAEQLWSEYCQENYDQDWVEIDEAEEDDLIEAIELWEGKR